MPDQTAARPLVVQIDDNEGDLELGEQAVAACCGDKVEYRGIARATTALEVLATLAEPGAPPIALIIVDVNLPRINGWEIVAFIKADPALRSARLAVMSGSNSARDIARARAAAVDYRIKPPTFSALCTLVCELIGPDYQ
jgi:CheY-like chemotaxis protein